MNKTVIEKTVEIKATAKNLWRAFTDPVITRQMGGEYITDWKPGSPIGWKGIDGNIYSNGVILQLEPEKIIQHSLFNLDDPNDILSVITYQLDEAGGHTSLYAREELSTEMPEEEYKNASEGWDYALRVLKEKAEDLDKEIQ